MIVPAFSLKWEIAGVIIWRAIKSRASFLFFVLQQH